jgi:ketosteroid isomerase-like protein
VRLLLLNAEVTNTREAGMSVEENKELVKRAVEAFDRLDPDALAEVLSPELAAGWRAAISTLPFSEHRIKITDLVAEGDQVAIRVETQGVHSQEWEGVPPAGKRWTNRGMALARVQGGRIVQMELLFDELGHLKQLGATITPPA